MKYLIAVSAILFSATTFAGQVGTLNSFSPNTTASSSDVNQNFNDIKTEVNDNDGRITTNSNDIMSNADDIQVLYTRPQFFMKDGNDMIIGYLMSVLGDSMTFMTSKGYHSTILNRVDSNGNSFVEFTRAQIFFTGLNCSGDAYTTSLTKGLVRSTFSKIVISDMPAVYYLPLTNQTPQFRNFLSASNTPCTNSAWNNVLSQKLEINDENITGISNNYTYPVYPTLQ